ncbi:putative hemolysin [Ruegeria meonggei]|uniref:Hemolysin n=1 Tax=Ruegeria meonggei TaxID=1446476 RepID=A0A1X6YHN2_9RHOB|nr:DUF333 domain-containing protein [Ruegeria meonggei]SLN20919.1 hypothetical protein RUM8411_00746 [Ruegeria meonggei]
MSRILLSALGLALLAACDESLSSDATAQLANPAATYCIDSGARYEIRDGDNGQSGVCILPDGTEIDAWEYFRENHSG